MAGKWGVAVQCRKPYQAFHGDGPPRLGRECRASERARPTPFVTSMQLRTVALCLLALTAGASLRSLAAQAPAFQSPGMSPYSTMGQTTRFSTDFNPSFGFVIDAFADYLDVDDGDDGFDAAFRLMEFNAAAYVDPEAWAYATITTTEELEQLAVEEAAIEYLGFGDRSTLTIGRFFVDFGKQMQEHVEELRTIERPLVLREFLGEELSGTGLEFNHWFEVNESTPVRFSLGVFASLLGEEEHHSGGEDEPEVETEVPERKDVDELSILGRVTGMTDVGERGKLQLGVSGRVVPEFAFEFGALEQDGLSNTVYGADVSYLWASETGVERFLIGGEWLVFDGDLAGVVDDPNAPTVLNVIDDSAHGYYTYADYQWNEAMSAGVNYSWIEAPESPDDAESELDLYVTRRSTSFRRLRLGVTLAESDVAGDSTRVFVQFTNIFGAISHGINW